MYKPVLVLVIDDVDSNLLMLSTLLKREGFAVAAAASGPQGRALARELAPDLILLDILMPDEDGFATCRLLKQDPATAAIPIVFLSALEDSDSRVKGLSMGAADFITKPFMKDEVLVRIRSHVRLRRDLALYVENLGHFLSACEEDEDCDERAFDYADIASGIRGYICARSPTPERAGRRAVDALKRLLPRVATPLLSPEESVSVLSWVLHLHQSELAPLPAAYLVHNRNASRLSVVLAGDVLVLLPQAGDAAACAGRRGEELGARDALFPPRADYPFKQGSRVCALLHPFDDPAFREALRARFFSGLLLPLDAQLEDLRALSAELDPSCAADMLFLFEAS